MMRFKRVENENCRVESAPFASNGVIAHARPEGARETVSEAATLFLDSVVRDLALLPRGKRAEIRDELSMHLDALIAARIELGESPQLAATAALQSFGSAKAIARRFQWAWIMPRQRTQRDFLSEAARYVALALTLSLLGSAIIKCEVQMSFYNPAQWRIPNYLWTNIWSVYFGLIPAWLGRRAVLRSLATGGLSQRSWAALILQVACAYGTDRVLDSTIHHFVYRIPFSLNVVEVLKYVLLYMIPIGVLAALLTRSRREGSSKRAFGWAVAIFTGWTFLTSIHCCLIEAYVSDGPSDRMMAVAQYYFLVILLLALFGSRRSHSATGTRAAESIT